jgi:recombination protein RecT
MTMATRTPPNGPAGAGDALARRRENGGKANNTLADQIRKMESDFQVAMPRGAEATQLVRDALTALRMTPKLAECEHTSVLGALMTCAQLGLRPGVLGHAWPLPFWDNRSRGYKAQLVIGYQGFIELAHRSGQIRSLIARTVYANDQFDVDYGLADSLVHKPNLFEERGDPIAYYAVAKFVSGGHVFMVMTQKEMLRYRDLHAKSRTREGRIIGPWVDNFEGMAHKTCVRQLFKFLPKSTEMAVALAADDGVRVDLTPTVDAAEATEHLDVVEGEVVDDREDGPLAEAPVSGPPNGNSGRPATAKQKKDIAEAAAEAGADADGLPAYVSGLIGRDVASLDELTTREAAQALARIHAYLRLQEPPAADASGGTQ